MAASPDRSSPVLMHSPLPPSCPGVRWQSRPSSPSIRFWKEAIFCFSVEETRSWLEGVLTSLVLRQQKQTHLLSDASRQATDLHKPPEGLLARRPHSSQSVPASEQEEIQLSRSQCCQVPCLKLYQYHRVFQDAYLEVLERSREAGGRGAVKACGCAAAQKPSDPGNAACGAATAGAVAARLQCECSSKGC